jgi:hypothetical protein
MCDVRTAALARLWTLSQIESVDSRKLIRQLLDHDDEAVRHAALNAVSLQRDTKALSQVIELLGRDTSANRRAAAEALGRLGDAAAVAHLLSAAANADDRILQHSIIYALIELNDSEKTHRGVSGTAPGTIAAALMALDQMPSGSVKSKEVIPLLNSPHARLRDTARWIVTQHTEWGVDLAEWFRGQLTTLPALPTQAGQPATLAASSTVPVLQSMLVAFSR